ncbi:MAG: BrnT family toxin [Candidatus Berkelbacteria bacterium]
MDIYKKLEKLTEFDWDAGNIEKNLIKHKITNSESEEVFFNPNLVLPDDHHSTSEARYFLLGETETGRVIFIVFTIRGDKIRVISSRVASHKERKIYNNFKHDEKRNSKI